MNKHFFFLSAAAVLLFSCSREPEQVIQPGETITFTAGWAGSEDTRTILQSDGTSVWWEPGAQVNVFFSDKASGKFTSTNSQAQAIVDFQGSLPIVVGSVETENPAHAYWAVYPYDATNTCDGESVTLTIPSTQTAVEGTFANKMFPSIATSTNFHLAFYNICGGVRFTVANEGIASVTFKANNGESLAGKVMVGFDEAPMIKNLIEGTSEVVVNAPEGGFVPGKYYFAALLPQTLSKGVSLEFKKSDGKVASTSLDNSISINRSRFGKMESKDEGLEFKDGGSGHNPSDNIVFADIKVKERLVARFDTNGDGELSYAEAAAVTSIEGVLTIKTITSFDEFQFFTGVTSIPNSYFENWTKLRSITLPKSISSIGESAFYNCPVLSSICIPDGVKSIERQTFSGCTNLDSVIIPESVTSIGDGSFSLCSSLSSIIIPKNVESIGKSAFFECLNLNTVTLSDRIKIIGDGAFRNCSGLSSIVIPDSVTTIDNQAFYFTGLTSVFIPKGVTYIGDSAFCIPNLASIIVDSNNVVYDSRDGSNAIIKTSTNALICGSKSTIIPESVTAIENNAFKSSTINSITIPNGVLRIGTLAFCGSSLTSIVIPESVTKIGSYAFCECEELSNVVIPESITSIEISTFNGCKSLVSINLPESISTIGSDAFSYCSSLSQIIIPASVTYIQDYAFAHCSSLISITVLAEIPPSCQNTNMFIDTNDAPIFVPANSVTDYKESFGWSFYADRIQPTQ